MPVLAAGQRHKGIFTDSAQQWSSPSPPQTDHSARAIQNDLPQGHAIITQLNTDQEQQENQRIFTGPGMRCKKAGRQPIRKPIRTTPHS